MSGLKPIKYLLLIGLCLYVYLSANFVALFIGLLLYDLLFNSRQQVRHRLIRWFINQI